MLCLSGFELYSRWVPLYHKLENHKTMVNTISLALHGLGSHFKNI